MSLVPRHIKLLQPYKAGRTIESVKNEYNLDKIVKLASNENPIGPSKKALKAIETKLDTINRYPDSHGLILRKKLAVKFNVQIENVILGAGSEGIMSSIMRTFLRTDDEIISCENSFIGFRVLANASGRRVNWVPMKNFKYDLSAIVEQINEYTKIIYLANPDNPTGTYFSIKEFDDFMNNVPERVLVILDEAYFEYSQAINDYPDSMLYRYDNVITLRTFSKIYGLAGLRVGYGFAHQDLISNLMKVKLPFEPSIPAQVAAIAAIDDKEHLNQSIRVNKLGMDILKKGLNQIGLNYIESIANFVTIVFDSDKESSDCAYFLLKNGIVVRELNSFGLFNCIRVTIGTENENMLFLEQISKYKR